MQRGKSEVKNENMTQAFIIRIALTRAKGMDFPGPAWCCCCSCLLLSALFAPVGGMGGLGGCPGGVAVAISGLGMAQCNCRLK